MSSTGHLPELESLRSQVADLARELAERDQAMQARQQGVDGELQDLRKQSDLLRAIMEGTAADTGDDFFASLAAHLTSTLHMQYAVIGEILDGMPSRIRTLAVSSGGQLLDNFEYDLAQAPCETGLTESFWCFPQNVQTLFPNFPPLAAMGVESHSGVSIRNKQGKVVSLIVVMDTQPIAHQDRLQTLLQVFAPRVAAELQRKQAEAARHETERQLRFTQFAIDHAVDGVLWADESRRFIYANDAVCRSLGYSREELLGLRIADIAPHHDPERFQRRLDEIKRGTPAIYESIHRRKDGSEFPVEVSVTFLEHEGNGYSCGIIRDITERRRIEQERLHALHNLQNIMDTVPDFMFTIDTRGNLVKWNRRVGEVTGYSAEALLNKPALDFVPPEEQDRTAAAIRKAFTEGYAELDGHLLTKEGRLIPYHWTGALLKDPYGEPIGITGVGRDVSEKKRADEALQRQQSRLVEARALAHLGSWEWDIESGETDWSEEQCLIFGHEPGATAVTYDTFLAALLPDDHDRVLAAVNDALLGACPLNLECRIVRPNGEVRVIHMRADIQRDATAHPVRMAGTVLDITERKQAEEALRASEERWHLAIQGSNDGIWDWNIRTGEVFFSTRWKEMRGYGELELTNSLDEWRSRIHPDDLDRVLQRLDAYLAKQVSEFCEEYRVLRKDGSSMWVLDRGVALWDRAGQPVRMAGSESDITIRKLAAEKLQRIQFAMDSAVDAIYWIDPSANILYANDAAGAMLGYSPGELQTMTIHDLNPDFQADRWPEFWAGSRHRKSLTLESFQRAKQGHLIPVEIQVNFLAFDGQEFHCAFVRNIAERKQAEQALAERARLAEFVADISLAINQDQSVDEMIDRCIAKTVQHLDAAFVHVWAIKESSDRCERDATEDPSPDQRPWVSLPTSNGLSINLYGEHRRAPLRILKRGCPALERDTIWTNDVLHDDRFPNKQWMQENGLHSFAGIPLIVEGRVFGIFGIFGRTPLSEPTVGTLESVSRGMAAAIARKLMAEDLRRSKAQLSDIMENNPAVLYTRRVGDEWPFTFVTPNIFGLLGYTSIDMISDAGLWDSLMHPDDLAKLMAQTLPSFLRKGAETFVARLRHRDGQYRWIENQARLTHLGDGPLLMVGTMTEITERMQAEEAVARSRDLLTSFVEHTPAAVAMLDKDFRYLAVSHRWLQDYRLGDQNLTGKHHYDVFPEMRQMPEWQAIYQRCLAGAVERCDEDRLIREDGSEDWLQWEVRPWHDVTGEIGGIIMFTDVITERKRAEVALRESEARTRSILETALDAVISINDRGRIIGWNPQAEVMFGYSPQEALGLPLDETIIPARYRQAHAHGMGRMLQSGDGTAVRRRFEFFALHRDGHEFPVEFAIASTRINGRPMFSAFIRDITERKRTEEALQRSERQLRTVLDTLPIGVWFTDEKGHVLYGNPVGQRIWADAARVGLPQPGGNSLWWETIDHTESLHRWAVGTVLARGHDVPNEMLEIETHRGDRRTIRNSAVLVKGDAGEILGAIVLNEDITDRVRAEQALRQEHALLVAVMDAATDIIFVKDIAGRYIHMNRAGAHTLGMAVEEVIGWNEYALWPSDLAASCQLTDRRVLESGEPITVEETSVSDGKTTIYLTTKAPYRDPEGRIIGVIGVARDITERKQAEEALRASEERFAKAFRSSPYPIIISEVESGLFIDANDAAFRSFGYRHEEVTNRTSTEFQLWPTPDHRRRFVEHLQQAGAIRNLEIDLRIRSGELRHCLVSAELIELHGKRCMVTVGSDITEQKRAEQNLQRSHAFIRQIIDTDPNFIFAKDREGRFTLVNKAFADAYGSTVDKLIGRTDADFNRNTEEVASFLSKDRDVIEHLQDQFIPEERITDATGAIRWLQTVKRPILDEAGRAIMILGASTDITERKRIEEALRQRERDLRAALEERERISQDLHDGILQSLYAVGLGLEACKPLMTHRHYKKAVATMTEAIGQLNHVMSEVRNFIAGLESQVLQGSTFPVALHEMVNTLAATHPLRCTVSLDKTAADHISTEQALHLLNIVREALSNSLRHAQATKATVMLKPLSRFIRLSIADNGIGFDPASMRGVGHGLTNMAARARKVGGRFAVRSLPQHGTRITIDLPKETSHAESEREHGSTAARR